MRRATQDRSVNHTWIAARRLVHRLPLAMYNTKHFAGFGTFDGSNSWTWT